MLHVRDCYVSKAAIFAHAGALARRLKIEVPLEFQGRGSLAAAFRGDGFFPCEFHS
jgi:hypothetical protein